MEPRLCRRLPILAVGLAVLVPATAAPQVPAGSEFRVNTYTFDGQRAPAVAREPDGDFVVVWHSYTQDGSDTGIFGQRYDASGAPRGAEFQVNTYTTGYQYGAWVSADARGRFVVVWTTYDVSQDGDLSGIHGQRFAADGSRLGGEFTVNTYTTGDQYWARVSANPAGDFVVVWESRQDGSLTSIHAQRFDRTGQRRGSEFQVNQATVGYQDFPDVKLVWTGYFGVGWSGPDGGDTGVYFNIFQPDGTAAGPEFRVNSYTAGFQNYPTLGVTPGPFGVPFVVAWQSLGQDGSGYGVFARRFNPQGVPLGAEFQVNAYTTGFQSGRPIVNSDDRGNFVVSWRTLAPQDGSGYAAMARRFAYTGAPRSSEFVVNTYTTGYQDMAHVSSDPSGNFTMAWRSFGQDGSFSGVYGQRFGGLHPRALEVDTSVGPTQDGNRVFEPGETVNVRPSWQNLNGAAQTFAGTLQLIGFSGCSQGFLDNSADYGTVANGATMPCSDCYALVATPSNPRCRAHWDAFVMEGLTPDILGQAKSWTLHIGDSFTDVARNNVFYRFVETLFHHNVTGGCTTTGYCPSSSTTRQQMPVFVLVAKEGDGPGALAYPGYQPAACSPPNMFEDVPETSPFCRWVEELARRGVVAGCSTNPPLYCPGDPVTRQQMPVFVLRTLDPALSPPACVAGSEMFGDVPSSNPFCRWIEELARRGVVTGCGGGNYCPADPVTREQMAVFISVTFGLELYGP